jgi:hypothetical protein
VKVVETREEVLREDIRPRVAGLGTYVPRFDAIVMFSNMVVILAMHGLN